MATGRFSISSSVTSFDNNGTISANVSLVPPTTITKSRKTYAKFNPDCLETNYSNVNEATVRVDYSGANYIRVTAGLFIKYNNLFYCVQQIEKPGWKILTAKEMSSAGLSTGDTDSDGNGAYWYVRIDNTTDLTFTFTVPKYIAQGESLYVAVSGIYDIDMYYDDGASRYYGKEIGESNPSSSYNYAHTSLNNFADYIEIKSCNRSYTMGSVSISYPTFCASDKSIITIPSVYNAYKMVLQRSLDNGSTWSDIYTNSTASSLDGTSSWTITYNNFLCSNATDSRITATLNAAAPIPKITYTDSGRTSTAIYRALYYGKSTVTKTGGTSEVLDLTSTTPSEMTLSADYNNRAVDSITISKTSITDRTRIKFREAFVETSLPNRSFTADNTNLTYTLESLDSNNSLNTNLGNYFTHPNGSYEYRVYPSLDGAENYVSSAGTNYISLYYVKNTTKLEMIRPIEMGQQMAETLKLIINPAKENIPAGSSFTIYVANNGNDASPAWEELPMTCIGSTSNPEVDTYMFSNTTKTADTWKLLIKVVADKGTATSDFYLTYMTTIINGGEAAESAFDSLDKIVLDALAKSIDIEIPDGYNHYKVFGTLIPNHTSATVTLKVNGLASGYRTVMLKTANSSTATLSKSTATNSAGVLGTNPTANNMAYLECDLIKLPNATNWQIVSKLLCYTGLTYAQSQINPTGGLNKLNIASSNTSYGFAAGSSLTIVGVK